MSRYLLNIILATLVCMLTHTKNRSCLSGMSLSLTTAVSTVMMLSTKLTLSLTPSTMRMSAGQLRLQFVGIYQVTKRFNREIIIKDVMTGYQRAVVEYEFNYRNCCNDEDGNYFLVYFKTTHS